MTAIGFIGVGNMGGPMARKLLKAGHKVTAFDLSAAVLDPVIAAGAGKASSANDAVQGADAVVTMLPAGEHIREVFLQVAIYCGVPAAVDSFRIAREAFAEYEKEK